MEKVAEKESKEHIQEELKQPTQKSKINVISGVANNNSDLYKSFKASWLWFWVYLFVVLFVLAGEFGINHFLSGNVLDLDGFEAVMFAFALGLVCFLMESFFMSVYQSYMYNHKCITYKIVKLTFVVLVIATLIIIGLYRWQAHVNQKSTRLVGESNELYEDKITTLQNNDATGAEIKEVEDEALDKEQKILQVIGVNSIQEAHIQLLNSPYLKLTYILSTLLLGLLGSYYFAKCLILYRILIRITKADQLRKKVGKEKELIKKEYEEIMRAHPKLQEVIKLQTKRQEVASQRTQARIREVHQKAMHLSNMPDLQFENQDFKSDYYAKYYHDSVRN